MYKSHTDACEIHRQYDILTICKERGHTGIITYTADNARTTYANELYTEQNKSKIYVKTQTTHKNTTYKTCREILEYSFGTNRDICH